MAYIDREKLIRDLIDNKEFYPALVKRAIENAPTEDVVPRSEVEKAKQEVAREIFEEIEKNTEFCIRFIENTTLFDNEEEIRKAKLECYRDCVEYFKKFKKKYIGE
jgi:hypothetical protein